MTKLRWPGRVLAGLGLTLATIAGCQTWHPGTGQTLPSPRYLEHPPQYLPPSPPFPLARELASMERTAAAVPEPGAPPAVPLPPAVPGPAMQPPVPMPPGGGGGGPAPLPPPP
ncbi:MAG: hypothetical protein U0840_07000 [Gemmataceae bacterium]